MERIEGLVDEGRALTAALRTNAAMHAGKTLGEEYDAWQARLRRIPGTPVGALDEQAKRDIARVIASWSRVPVPVS